MTNINKELQVKLEKEQNITVVYAQNLQITDNTEYQNAGEFLRGIAQSKKSVKAVYEPVKQAANEAHKRIVAEEKKFLEPLMSAEQIIKGKIVTYDIDQAQIRAEEQARQKAEQERIAIEELKKAEEMRSSGNEIGAKIIEETALAISEMKPTEIEQPKVDGISFRKAYEIIYENEDLIPISLNGIVLRPVDKSIINELAKMTNGKIKIDGVKIVETKIVSVRS